MIRRTWLLLAAALAFGAASCEEPAFVSESGPIEFHVSDSAGVRIAETSGGVLTVDLPWTIDTVPDLQLGGAGSRGPELFHRLGGARRLLDGTIVVLDGGSQELRWFDESGPYLRSFGGQGEGPGEFDWARLLADLEPNSLLLFDQRLRRFTDVTADGADHRIWEVAPTGLEMLMGAAHGRKGQGVLFTVGSGECIEAEYCESSTFVRWVNPRTGTVDTLAAFARKRHRIRDANGLPFAMDGPFDPVVAVTVGPGGAVITGGPEHALRLFDERGRLVAILRVDAPNRSPTHDELEYLINERVGRGLPVRAVEEAVARMGVPEATPAFQEVLADRVGWYWARIYHVDRGAPSRWLVFDAEGQARGMIQMPEGLLVYEIGQDYVLGRWLDEFGVEYLRLHRLTRGAQ